MSTQTARATDNPVTGLLAGPELLEKAWPLVPVPLTG